MVKDRISTVLVVDDDEENIAILSELLEGEYEVSVAMEGATAVAVAFDQQPHLILLDILMSGMDGYEVCRHLKQEKVTRDIPVIFISSLANEADQEEGLNLGAVDYITKPFSPSLVRSRVRNHVNLRRAQLEAVTQFDAIQDAYQKLRELEEQRDDMTHMLLHDLRTPLTALLAGLDYSLTKLRADNNAVPEVSGVLENAKGTGKKLNGMLTTLLDVGRLESGSLPLSVRECRVSDILQAALRGLQGLTQNHRLSVTCKRDELITCDPDILERVVTNLLMNALQHTPEQGEIVLAGSEEKTWTLITVADTGPGIPKEHHETIFQKFGRVATPETERGASAGLGLTFCKLAVDAHGGSIHVESIPGEGARFSVRLPRTASAGVVGISGRKGQRDADAGLGKNVITGSSITVFLISNDRMLLKSLTRYLETRTNWSITGFHDLARAVRTALIVRPDIVLLDIDMQHSCETDIFKSLESVISAKKSSIAYYTELLLPEETDGTGYSLAKGGQPVIPKSLPLARFLDILVMLMKEKNAWLQRAKSLS
jgi:signal transduction histidine kinase